jgi:hypothetical protein
MCGAELSHFILSLLAPGVTRYCRWDTIDRERAEFRSSFVDRERAEFCASPANQSELRFSIYSLSRDVFLAKWDA